MFMTIFSLGGLPPFLGFLPKWIVIESMISMNLYFYSLIMIMMTMITLYFYLWMSFSSLIMNNIQTYWKKFNNYKIFYGNFFLNYFFPAFLFYL